MNTKNVTGLSDKEVAERIKNGQTNYYQANATKSTSVIIRENVMTLFNFLNFFLAICLFAVKAYTNLFFILIIVINILIGIIQEIRARNLVEKLTLISQDKVSVFRNTVMHAITPEALVIDDIVLLNAGDQVPSDMTVLQGTSEVNESMLTGEADTVSKTPESQLFSGSYLTSGQVIAKVIHVGSENYSAKLVDEAKAHKPITSELLQSIGKISKFTSFVIIPIGILLFAQAYFFRGNPLPTAVIASVAALLGMLPKGLVLLISIALSTAVIKLAKKNILIQNMYAVETFAHLDMICLDKTGTLTQGKMRVENIIVLNEHPREQVQNLLSSYLYATTDANLTITALKEQSTPEKIYTALDSLPFSSDRKWGAIEFEGLGTCYLGSPENLLSDQQIPQLLIENQQNGLRVLLIAIDQHQGISQQPKNLEPIGFITLSDPIRKNAKQTLDFLKKQDVQLKVISGDNPNTVSAIAKEAGFADYQNAIDLSTCESDEEVQAAALKYSVFGRVSPQQKKIIVQELKNQQYTVGMTGDGVNDILALREADVSIAMAEGDGATRQIADIVLLDSDFSKLTEIIYEGRRVVNNVTRSSSVFFIKTIYSFLLSLLCILFDFAFPFIPIQITLIDLAIEGYPAFFLSFEEDPRKVSGSFLKTALAKASPSALLIIINILCVLLLQNIFSLSTTDSRSLMYYLLVGISCLAVVKSCLPLNKLRLFLASTTIVGSFTAIFLFSHILTINHLSLFLAGIFGLMMVLNTFFAHYLFDLSDIYLQSDHKDLKESPNHV